MNKVLKKAAFLILGNKFRIQKRIRTIKNKKLLTVVNLHRVMDSDMSTYEPLSTKLFEKYLVFIKKNFRVICFDDLNNPDHLNSSKPLLILSFDDGYKDFIEYAMPLLDKYKLRVNQNFIPECVESGLPPLNVLAQDFIGKAPLSLLENLIIPGFIWNNTARDRMRYGLAVSKYLKNKTFAEQNVLKSDIYRQIFNYSEFQPTAMMSLDDARECSLLHETGAHSYHHSNMEYEEDDFFKNDLIMCKNWFKVNFGKSVNIYAFPNGSYKKKQIEMAYECDYHTVLLVSDSFSKISNIKHDRFGLHGDSLSELKYKGLGGLLSC